MKKLIVLASLAMLANGCTSESPSSSTTTEKVVSIATSPCDVISKAALTPSKSVQVNTSEAFTTLISDSSSGFAGGKTAGASIAIDSDCEKLVSGNTIELTFSARSAASTKLKAAYSTNEVGNSGWRTFEVTPQFETYKFEYHVPNLKSGGSDFVGFLPEAGTVEIKNIALTIK